MLTLEHLAALFEAHQSAFHSKVTEFSVGGPVIPFNARPSLMGVINLSADSWYRESVCLTTESAIRRGIVLAAQGANLVDLGAESTLAHAALADSDRQKSILLPVIRELRKANVAVSVETYQPTVAKAALETGANVLNLTGTEHSERIYPMVAEHEAAVIISYIQGKNVRAVDEFRFSADPISMMYEFFAHELEVAKSHGVEKIFIDPGMGFYYRNLQDSVQRVRFQMQTFLNTFRLRALGYPICHALPHAFEYFGEQVRTAEPFFAVLAALGGANLFRTHEIARVKGVLDTMQVYDPPPATMTDH